MNDEEIYIKEITEDSKKEKSLWKKELLVILILVALSIFREVYLHEWFNYLY